MLKPQMLEAIFVAGCVLAGMTGQWLAKPVAHVVSGQAGGGAAWQGDPRIEIALPRMPPCIIDPRIFK